MEEAEAMHHCRIKRWVKTHGCPVGQKLEYRKFYLNKNQFKLQVVKHWIRLLREVVESPHLDIFRSAVGEYYCIAGGNLLGFDL